MIVAVFPAVGEQVKFVAVNAPLMVEVNPPGAVM
jgi:hypothetical protein